MGADESSELMRNLMMEMPILFKELFNNPVFDSFDAKKMRTLFVLNNLEWMNMTDCSKKLGMTKSNFTYIANDLVEAGYVSRRFDKSDRRLIYLEITEDGRSYAAEQLTVCESLLKSLLISELSEEDIRELNSYINKVIHILNRLIKREG